MTKLQGCNILANCLILAAAFAPRAQTQPIGWSGFRTVEKRISMQVKMGTFNYEGGERQQSFQFRNDNEVDVAFDYEVHYFSGGRERTSVGTYKLVSGAVSGTMGAFVIGDASRGITALITKISLGGARTVSQTKTRNFSRPEISGFELEPRCVALLKSESEKLKFAGAAKSLLAWTPLLTLAGENSAFHALFFIKETSWDEVAESFPRVDKLTLITLANEARVHANSGDHYGNPKAKKFWDAMADFYQWQADK